MNGTRASLVDATHRLTHAGVPSPAADAELLLAHVLGVSRGNLILSRDITDEQQRAYNDVIEQRCRRKPLQHLTGEAGFRRLTLAVGPGVFVPRPETELLVELAIRHLKTQPSPHQVWDLCAGSGAISLSIATEVPNTHVTSVELSPDACVWLQRNRDAHLPHITETGSSVTVVQGDATTAHTTDFAVADVVACNPPYIPDAAVPQEPEVAHYDPPMALYGGPDGLDIVRKVADVAAQLLKPDGLLLIEHADVQGDESASGVPALLRQHTSVNGSSWWRDVQDYRDLAGRPRVTAAYRTESPWLER